MSELVSQIGQFTYDGLIGGTDPDLFTKNVVIVGGSGILARGTVLGKITLGAVTAEAKAGGNTGDGAISGLALGVGTKTGVYTVRCITAAANSGTFSVIGPDGIKFADAIVGTAYVGPVHFQIADGAADFVVGDGFDITVDAGSGKYKIVNSANTDGSQNADCILAFPVDATIADVLQTAYQSGLFNREHLIFGGTDTADQHEQTLRGLDIYLTSEKQ